MKKIVSDKCSVGVSRFILLTSTITLFMFGVLFFSQGIAAKVQPQKFSEFISELPIQTNEKIKLGELFVNTADFQLILGVFLILLCFSGCFGGCCDIRWMLLVYWVIVLLILILEVIFVGFFTLYPDQLDKQIHHAQEHSWEVYEPERLREDGQVTVPTTSHALYWFGIQSDHLCCGVDSYKDSKNLTLWNRTYVVRGKSFRAEIPPSCCFNNDYLNITDVDGLLDCMTLKKATHHKKGCFFVASNTFKEFAYIPIAVVVAVILVEAVSIAAAIHLWKKTRSEHTPI